MACSLPFRRMIASAALSGLSAVVLFWPGVLQAEDPEALAEAANAVELAPNATRFGDIVASSELVTDEKTKKHYVRLVAMNTSKEREAYAKIEVNVTETEGSGEARVAPVAEVRFERTFRLVLQPGATDVHEIPVSAQLAKGLDEVQKRERAMDPENLGAVVPPLYRSYEALVRIPSAAEDAPEQAAG